MRKRFVALAPSMAVLAFLTLFFPLWRDKGLATGRDVTLHVGNVVECAYLLSDRIPPLDWLPDIAGGRGGPNYIYYGSVGFLGPAILVRLGLDPVDAIRFWVGIYLTIGFLSAAFWCSLFGGWRAGLAGGALFVWGPYYYCLPYARAAYPELLAYSLYPLVFYFAHRSLTKGGWGPLVGCVIALFLVIATHTLSLMIVVPFLAAYFLVAGKISGVRSGIWKGAASLALCAVLLAPSLVGPILGRGQVVLGEQFSSEAGAQLYSSIGIPWYSFLNKQPEDAIMSRTVPGRVHLLCLLMACLAAGAMKAGLQRKMVFFHLGLALAALLLIEETVATLSVKGLPIMAFLQFPWRFLGMFNLFACAAFSASTGRDSRISEKGKVLLLALVPLVCVLVYSGSLPRQAARRFETRNREGIRASLTTLDHENKYVPSGAKLFEKPAPPVLLEVPDGDRFETGTAPNDYTYTVNLRIPQRATFHQYWFDGWRVEVDGKPCSLQKHTESGLCLVDLPAGVHEVRFHFARTALHATALGISTVGWLAILVAGLILALRRVRRVRPAPARPGTM